MTGRSIAGVRSATPEEGGGVCALCDCGTPLVIRIDTTGLRPGEAAEGAITCTGCGTSHRFRAWKPGGQS